MSISKQSDYMIFIDEYSIIIFSYNDLNNPLAQPAKTENQPALLPVGLICVFCAVSYLIHFLWHSFSQNT
jgi:hypothetical protein